MNIQLQEAGKRYQREWIFRKLSYSFSAGQSYAILGPNGSGKSTLLQVLAGQLTPTEGSVQFSLGGKEVAIESVYRKVALASPAMQLIEELTLVESIEFQSKFKPWHSGLDDNAVLELLQLPKAAHEKETRFFSSGMKQRLKLAFAILSDTPILLLDEPSITLDAEAIAWYQSLLDRYCGIERILVIATNVPADVERCSQRLDIRDFKNK